MSPANFIFNCLATLDNFYWSNIWWLLICLTGIYLTIISKGLQFKTLTNFRKNIKELVLESSNKDQAGINPFKLYFTSVGGMVGLGNIVGITALLCLLVAQAV